MSRRRCKLLLVVFALSALGVAGAQVPGGGRHRGASAPDASATHGAVGSATPTNRLRDEMDAFADELQLQPAQQSAFNDYRQRMLQFAGDIERAENGGIRVGAGAAPKQLEALSDVVHDRALAVDDIVTAVNTLYPLLNPQQRHIADGKMAWMLSSLMEGDNPPPPPERALTPTPDAKTPQPPPGS
jgi:hypothetical protein